MERYNRLTGFSTLAYLVKKEPLSFLSHKPVLKFTFPTEKEAPKARTEKEAHVPVEEELEDPLDFVNAVLVNYDQTNHNYDYLQLKYVPPISHQSTLDIPDFMECPMPYEYLTLEPEPKSNQGTPMKKRRRTCANKKIKHARKPLTEFNH